MPVDPIINLDPDQEPWDRQPRESIKMYARFIVFRDMGTARSLTACAEILNATQDSIKKSSLKMVCWSYRWIERAEAWDHHQLAAERERMATLRRDMIERHRRLALGLIGKAAAAMSNIEAADMSAVDVVRFLTLGTTLERQAIGEPERVAVSGPTGGAVQFEDLSAYTPQQRQQRLAQIADELARRAGRSPSPGDGDDD